MNKQHMGSLLALCLSLSMSCARPTTSTTQSTGESRNEPRSLDGMWVGRESGLVAWAAPSLDYRWLVAATKTEGDVPGFTACVWDFESGEVLHRHFLKNPKLNAIGISGDQLILQDLGCLEGLAIQKLDLRSGAAGKAVILPNSTEYAQMWAFCSPDARYYAVVDTGFGGDAVVWEAASGKEVYRFALGFGGGETHAAFDGANQFLVVGTPKKNALLFLDNTKRPVELPSSEVITNVAVSPDGRLIAMNPIEDHPVLLYDVEKRAVVRELVEKKQLGMSVGFSPDSQYLLASEREWIRVWNVKSGELRCTLGKGSHHVHVEVASFLTDGRVLSSGAVSKPQLLIYPSPIPIAAPPAN